MQNGQTIETMQKAGLYEYLWVKRASRVGHQTIKRELSDE